MSRIAVDNLFTPSPIGVVSFPDGKVVAMNRRERRRRGLFGDRLKAESIVQKMHNALGDEGEHKANLLHEFATRTFSVRRKDS